MSVCNEGAYEGVYCVHIFYTYTNYIHSIHYNISHTIIYYTHTTHTHYIYTYSIKELVAFYEREIADAFKEHTLLSLHLKATMMKVSG